MSKKVGKHQKSNLCKTYSELVKNLKKKSVNKKTKTQKEMAEEILNLAMYQDHSPIEDQKIIIKKIRDLFDAHFTKDMLINLIMKNYGYQWTIKEVRRILSDCLTPKWWSEIRDHETDSWKLDRSRLEDRINFRSLPSAAQLDKIVQSQMNFIKEHNPTISKSMLSKIHKSIKEHNRLWNKNHKQEIVLGSNPFTGQAVYEEYQQGYVGGDVRGMRPSGVLDLETGSDATK